MSTPELDQMGRDLDLIKAGMAHIREVLVEFLCGTALADHLGDVRECEVKLWRLLSIERSEIKASITDWHNPYRETAALLRAHGISPPDYLEDT